ncbi:hypothetical protein QBC39DRAFT_34012 [Podospora conica]|nr:hypothetical protein QBC39DRAFT_34012 [Schizothecium conicum]
MSAAKFGQPVYKVYEVSGPLLDLPEGVADIHLPSSPQPGYHLPHRTIILDEQIESPETLTIRLEEEAARNGGDLSGDSPTGLLPMSAYKPHPPQLHGYADSPYSQYSAQSFSTQQSDNASQINQLAFAANNAAGQYLGSSSPSISIVSCHPTGGSFGTKVALKVTSQFDLTPSALSASAPFVSILFGTYRCAAQIMRTGQDSSGTPTYTVTAEAPQFLSTTCPSLSNVPVTLVVESSNGAEMARATSATAVFSYHDAGITAAGSVGVGISGDTSPPDLGSPRTRSPVPRGSPPHQVLPAPINTSSPSASAGLSSEATNTYGFNSSLSTVAVQAHAQPDYVSDSTAAYNQGSSTIGYRGNSFGEHYPRVPLRSPHNTTWTPFGTHHDSIRSSATTMPHPTHTAITRPSLTPLPHSSNAPQLFRTSTINQQSGGGGAGGGYNPYALYQTKATLNINGNLNAMVEGWTPEEWENKRRLVLFSKKQNGSVLTTTFRAVSASDLPPRAPCVSCIWWQEKGECYVTSVDTISLLEHLVAAPQKFTVDEKNRIRRNLEGFRPLTVSKTKAESEEFFKVIMSFGNPKPRNIEKDVKVFPWSVLGQALTKIISKYSASTGSLAAPSSSGHIMPPAGGMGGSYGMHASHGSTSSGGAGSSAGYLGSGQHGDSAASPSSRALSGGASSWGAYGGAASRTMSPSIKTSPPISTSGIRMSALPAAYDPRGAAHGLTSPYTMAGSAHSGGYGQNPGVSATQPQSRSWDGYSTGDGYASNGSQGQGYNPNSNSSHGQGYNPGPYGDGAPRP